MRLIDADALDMYERLKSYYGDAWRDAQEEIDNAQTVDAVQVIRCKDCKYYEPDLYANPWGVCCHLGWIVNVTGNEVDENGYCYRAERRDDD